MKLPGNAKIITHKLVPLDYAFSSYLPRTTTGRFLLRLAHWILRRIDYTEFTISMKNVGPWTVGADITLTDYRHGTGVS